MQAQQPSSITATSPSKPSPTQPPPQHIVDRLGFTIPNLPVIAKHQADNAAKNDAVPPPDKPPPPPLTVLEAARNALAAAPNDSPAPTDLKPDPNPSNPLAAWLLFGKPHFASRTECEVAALSVSGPAGCVADRSQFALVTDVVRYANTTTFTAIAHGQRHYGDLIACRLDNPGRACTRVSLPIASPSGQRSTILLFAPGAQRTGITGTDLIQGIQDRIARSRQREPRK